MKELMKFTILNWNMAGAKYLEEPKGKREKFKKNINEELCGLLKKHNPDVVTLQEIVKYGDNKEDANDILDVTKYKESGYVYHTFPLIDTENLSIRAKWNKLEKKGEWNEGTYFAQCNGFLFKKDIPHQPIWALPKDSINPPKVPRENYIEKVSLESGLYFGDRDSEPRAALVAHFVYNTDSVKIKGKSVNVLDIFVVNLHLTTLTMEREGVPEIDRKATKIRLSQLDIIFDGIVSRYNSWRQGGFRERGEHRQPEDWESFDRHEPLWILAGDFNSTPESPVSHEYKLMEDLNFMDMVYNKGKGTKAPGTGEDATLTLDYIFAGPKFIALNPLFIEGFIKGNKVFDDIKVSDHFPMVATIPIWR